jgi:hypothetical protein
MTNNLARVEAYANANWLTDCLGKDGAVYPRKGYTVSGREIDICGWARSLYITKLLRPIIDPINQGFPIAKQIVVSEIERNREQLANDQNLQETFATAIRNLNLLHRLVGRVREPELSLDRFNEIVPPVVDEASEQQVAHDEKSEDIFPAPKETLRAKIEQAEREDFERQKEFWNSLDSSKLEEEITG